MKKVCIININNSRSDFAKAFNFIDKTKRYNEDVPLDSWEKEHIFLVENVQALCGNYYSDTNNEIKRIVACTERVYEQKRQCSTIKEFTGSDELFYFRVINSSDNDIVNFHYFYLMSDKLETKCAMGIITEDTTNERALIKERMTASFLVCERENFSQEGIRYQIVEYRLNSIKDRKCQYKIKLVPGNTENVFFLRNDKRNFFKIPCSIDDSGINISRRFFPLLRIKDPKIYLILASTAKDVFGSKLFVKEKKNTIVYNDFLYQLVSQDNPILWNNEAYVKELFLQKKTLFARVENFRIEVLLSFAKKCYQDICSGMSAEKKRETEKYLKTIIEETSVLAICIFLLFWSTMKLTKTEDIRIDALLMDAEDYADGLLQLIENAIKHSTEGFFCFRVHAVGNNPKTDTEAYLNKYHIGLKEHKFYLEAMVSDYNKTYDIPKKFKDNLRNDLKKETNKREYGITEPLLKKIEDTFTLADLFNYENNVETNKIWREFYSDSKNITSHYGLLVFERLVKFSGGVFSVISSNEYEIKESDIYSNNLEILKIEEYDVHLPGTQYEILLPVGIAQPVRETGLNYTLGTDAASKKIECYWVKKEGFSVLCENNMSQDDKQNYLRPYFKNSKITNIAEKLIKELEDKFIETSESISSTIMCLDVEGISSPISSEILTKAFIAIINSNNAQIKEIKYFAFKNSTDQFMNTFIRNFSVLYLKCGQRDIMSGRQVYLCSNAAEKEVLFYDNSITKSLEATKSITLSGRGEPTREYRFMERQAEKSEEVFPETKQELMLLPFDVMVDGVFKDKVKTDLERNIEGDGFGCCLKDVHMRVGSKIHIHGNYYEASLLFGNSNYVSRFSFLIYDRIDTMLLSKDKLKNDEKLVLIGYEAYSESLMIELKHIINSNAKRQTDYMIYYEGDRKEPFSRWKKLKPDKSTKFVIVVPIGSTLTTYEKIVADLQRQSSEIDMNSVELCFTVVLIRNSDTENENEKHCRKIEVDFWEEFSTGKEEKDNYVIYKNNLIGANRRIDYFVCVENEWQLPNKCKYCFPEKKYLFREEPLIQSNRSSVIPMIMYGNQKVSKKISKLKTYEEDMKTLAPLERGLCYGHFVRDKRNHFQYYFQTDKVTNAVLETQKDEFEKWLKEVEKKIEKSTNDKVVFNFVVAPLHRTNAEFVHKVSQVINAKQIIWLDTRKEYRDNVKSKYNNLTALVENLQMNSSSETHIHFHFVDDTITSGFTFNRAKSLLQSLFPGNSANRGNVQIHLFSTAILLLNRCSIDTIQSYIPRERYFSYINLNISVMRSHSDACVPCKLHEEYSLSLTNGAATNIVSELSKSESKVYEMQEDSTVRDNNICADYYADNKKGFHRLMATQRLNAVLSIVEKKNDKHEIEKQIWFELNTIMESFLNNIIDREECYERFVSLIQVVSRPFLSYRYSVLKASLKVLLSMWSYILFGKSFDKSEKTNCFKQFIEQVVRLDKPYHQKFLVTVIECLTNINSTCIIRPNVINGFLCYCEKYNFDKEWMHSQYILCVKRLLDLSGKDNLSGWLEETMMKEINKVETIKSSEYKFLKLLLLENTLLIRNALVECFKEYENSRSKKIDAVVKNTLNRYYCKDYMGFLQNYAKSINYNQPCENIFISIFKLYIQLNKKPTAARDYYEKVVELIKPILNAKDIALFIQSDERTNRLYPDKVPYYQEEKYRYMENGYKNLLNKAADNIGDTFFEGVFEDETLYVLKLAYTKEQYGDNRQLTWYIVFNREQNNNEKSNYQLICSIRNLLAMRWILVKRFNEDFNNNIVGKFLDYKEEFQKLGTDKSGSHTPYKELSEAFHEINRMLKGEQNKTFLANQCKLIADSLISKWYVHSVMKTFPRDMFPGTIRMDCDKPIEYFKNILMLTRYASADNVGVTTHCNENIKWEIAWDKIVLDVPHNCGYIWCCAFQSAIFNALHHGYNYTNDDLDIVDVYVSYVNESFVIRNRMKEHSEIDVESVTLTALQYFFDSYYGAGLFNYKKDLRNDNSYDFVIVIPCRKGKNKDV